MPSSNDDAFFEIRQDWSRRKHLILDYYLPPAMAKLRTISPDRRVVILDGFAGRGQYEDGTPGSPVHMGRLADKVGAWTEPMRLRIHNIEPNPDSYAELAVATDPWLKQGIITNHIATFKAALPAVLDNAATSPLFVFLDPFRPKHLPFADMEPLFTRTSVTELLIVFHTPSVLRIIEQVRPHARTDNKTRLGSMQTLNEIFGGERWHRFLSEPPTNERIITCYVEELAAHWGIPNRSLLICHTPIEARYGSGLKYHIIFATRHPDGVRLINDAFVKEKRDIHGKTTHSGTSSMFEEFADPMDELHRPAMIRRTVLDAANTDIDKAWSYDQLILEAMALKFGEFSETDFKQTIRGLLEASTAPRFVGIEGDKLKNGKWKVDRKLRIRLEP